MPRSILNEPSHVYLFSSQARLLAMKRQLSEASSQSNRNPAGSTERYRVVARCSPCSWSGPVDAKEE